MLAAAKLIFHYLGLNILPTNSIITTDNYGTRFNNILADLTRWELILKKKILPRIKFCSSIPLTTSWVLE